MGLLKENKRYGATDVRVGHYVEGSGEMTSAGKVYEVRIMYQRGWHTDYEWEGGARFAGSGVMKRSYTPIRTVWDKGVYVGWINTSTVFVKPTSVHFFIASDISKHGELFDHVPSDVGMVLDKVNVR